MALHNSTAASPSWVGSLIVSVLSVLCGLASPTTIVVGQETACDSTELGSAGVTVPQNDPNAVGGTGPVAFANDRVTVKFSVAGVAQSSGVTGSWWNLSETFAPSANYKPDRAWGELWIKPGMTTDLRLSEEVQLYSGLSYVGSGNIGRDVFEQGNRGLYAIEDGYLGARMGDRQESSELDVSYGRLVADKSVPLTDIYFSAVGRPIHGALFHFASAIATIGCLGRLGFICHR